MNVFPRTIRHAAFGAALALLGGLLTACSGPATAQTAAASVVNVGYFPTLTHAPGLVADAQGFLAKRLGAVSASAA
ncbi:MAG: hypothetical protein WBJ44_11880, partial [Propionicimonas sp.]